MIAQVHLQNKSPIQHVKNVLCDSRHADYVAVCTNSDSLFHQNDLPAVDPNPTQTNTRRRCHIHVIFGGQRRQKCLSAVVALAVPQNVISRRGLLVRQEGRSLGLTSFSAFSFFKASMACISRMDSSTFPCSPVEPHRFSNHPANMTAFPLAETSGGNEIGRDGP